GVNAAISLARGNYADAALYAISAIPIAGIFGEAALVAKEAKVAVKTTEEIVQGAEKYVFYSGGEAARTAAMESAEREGATGIWATEFGAAIENFSMTAEEASTAFARSARGEAHVFSTAPFTNF